MASFGRCHGECRLGREARVKGHAWSVNTAQSASEEAERVGAH